ncbi:MAG TPA: isoprenylcysteine carboxylmethyltransferase family protein [Polyangiaceae bacterium]|nr:isoprenylcysteine carboxylmethyltransferase family protein [Polyangiaceae bacterium]
MARAGIKRALDKVFGPDLQRSGYVLCACFALLPIFFAWRPLPRVLWDLPHARSLCQFGFVIGVLTVYGAAFALDHFELLGLRQAWFGSAPSATATLNISGPYRIVRHPLMTGLLLLFWSTSRMTVGHFCFAAAMTTYVLLGTHFEERDLRRRFGHAYADYQASTPMFLPWPVRRRRQLVAEAIRENHSSHD